MASEITKAIKFLSDEKDLDQAVIMGALEIALAAAYRKDFGNKQQNVQVKFDPETGDMKVWDEKEVVEDVEEEVLEKAQEELADRREKARIEDRELTEEEVEDLPHFNPKTEIMLSEAKEHKKTSKVGDILIIDLELPGDFGRMAAQTAKQVIIQKVREAERNSVFEDFKEQEGGVVQGTVHRRDRGGNVLIDLGKINGILPQNEQVHGEFLRPGARMQFYVVSVDIGKRGPEIILSRSSSKMVESVFEQEIPEISNEAVKIKRIARDPGFRSKVAVWTDDEGIDPIGSCIGQRGSRITTIISELGGEKIDVIMYSDNVEQFIKNALSPAKVSSVFLDQDSKEAKAYVAEDQFSLAIGRNGQNVRLAAELTGWKIDVVQDGNDEKIVSSGQDPKQITELIAEKEGKEEEQRKAIDEFTNAMVEGMNRFSIEEAKRKKDETNVETQEESENQETKEKEVSNENEGKK